MATAIKNRAGRDVPLSDDDKRAQENLKHLWKSRANPRDRTQKMLGNSWGVTQPTISQYINGVIPLSFSAVAKFAEFLGADVLTIAPHFANLVALSKASGKLYIHAVLRKDGDTLMFHSNLQEVPNMFSPTPNSKAVLVERDIEGVCPKGTIIVYNAGEQLNKVHVLGNPRNSYVVVDDRGNRTKMYVASVDNRDGSEALVDTYTREPILPLSYSDEKQFPKKVTVHSIVIKACIAGL